MPLHAVRQHILQGLVALLLLLAMQPVAQAQGVELATLRTSKDDGALNLEFVARVSLPRELAALTRQEDFDIGIAMLASKVSTLVVTRSENGAYAVSGSEHAQVTAEPVAKVVDTTGAGDLFAAGFLFGHVRGRSLPECLRLGAVCAAEIISHYGARPEADLQALIAEKIG